MNNEPSVIDASVGARETLSGMSAPLLMSPSKKASGSSAFLARNSRMRGTCALSWPLQSASSSVMEAMPSTRLVSRTDSWRSGRLCRLMIRRASAKKYPLQKRRAATPTSER